MNRALPLWVVVITGFIASATVARAADTPSSDSSSSSSSGSSTAASGPACVAEKAKQDLETCPAGPTLNPSGHDNKPTMSFHSKVEELKKGDKKIGVGSADFQMLAGIRDARQTALHQRALALLVTEIQGLEGLYHDTQPHSKDRPMLLRRLAEDYVELENAAFTEKTQAEVRRDELSKSNPRMAGQQQSIANSRAKTMNLSRKAAVKYYTTLVTDYSGQPSTTFPQNPPPAYAFLDEVYYYLAYEYEQAGDTANARRVYLDLITKTPNSKYISNAYLAFGELFFNEALSDPSKWEPAKQAYQKVISKPPPENKVYGYAWYKLAYVFWNQGDLPHALDAFKKTIDFGTQFTQLPNAKKLAEASRKDVIPVYALAGSPTDAYNFFKNLSGDPAGQTDKTDRKSVV